MENQLISHTGVKDFFQFRDEWTDLVLYTRLGKLPLFEETKEKIRKFIIENKENLLEISDTAKDNPVIITREKSGLPHPLLVDENHIYVLKCATIGNGEHKKVKLAYDIINDKPAASYILSKSVEGELEQYLQTLSNAQKEFKLDGLVKIISCSTLPSKKYQEKILILSEYYSKGKLADNYYLTEAKLRKVINDIFKGIISLHQLGFVHLDIHEKNIVIDSNGSGGLIDFDLMKKIRENYEMSSKPSMNVSLLSSPEVIKQFSKKFMVFDEKADVWMFGFMLSRLYDLSVPFIISGPNTKNMEELKKYYKRMKSHPMPEPKEENSIAHLVWRMMEVDPEKRISMEEAQKTFKKIKKKKQSASRHNGNGKPLNFEYITKNKDFSQRKV